jgi:lysophospholipase L1-like esterase
MPFGRALAGVCLALAAASCGSGGGPTAPPPPPPTHPVGVALFYDENGNGLLDGGENVRIPDATIEIAGRQGRSAPVTGEAIIENVPVGTHTLAVRPGTLPPSFVGPPPLSLAVPQTSGTAFLPVTLPIGPNRPNVYLAFGDSITDGEGSADGMGYVSRLQRKLQAWFGRASVIKDGLGATRSNRGSDRLPDSLTVRPAYTLIHYGTNDWNQAECKQSPPCFTIESLRTMVRDVKHNQGLPVLGTIIPANPARVEFQPDRNLWVADMDRRIRDLARAEGALLADLEAAFLREPSVPLLFADHVHPSDAGYEVMAQAFFEAITRPAPAAASAFDGAPPAIKLPPR